MGQLIIERGRFLCVSIKGNNSHVKAQILLLLEEIVQDVLSHKVWVQGVVNDFSSPKLHKKRENICMGMKKLTPYGHRQIYISVLSINCPVPVALQP